MAKIDTYIAGYQLIDTGTAEESARLASPASKIGSPLTLRIDDESGDLILIDESGVTIGTCRPKNRLSLVNALEDAWTCHLTLSLVVYDKASDSYKGEFAYQCYNPDKRKAGAQEALDAYSKTTREAIALGNRPRIVITGSEYDAIVDSGGIQIPEGTAPLPKGVGDQGSGVVVYKRNESAIDKLIGQALAGNPGCKVASYVAIALVVALFAYIMYRIIVIYL